MSDDRPRNRPRVQSRGRRFPDQDITPARTHRDEVEEEKRKKRLARFGTLAKPKIKEVGSETREITKINGKKENLDMEEDASSSQEDREMREETGAAKSSKQEKTEKAESSKEEKTEKDSEEVGLLDPVKICASNVEKTASPSKSGTEEEEEGVGLLVPVEAVSSSEEEYDRKKGNASEKQRKDRLARFGTLEAPKIEQPFKPKKSAEKGDNMKPLWRDGRVRSRDRDYRESKTQDEEEGEDVKSTR